MAHKKGTGSTRNGRKLWLIRKEQVVHATVVNYGS